MIKTTNKTNGKVSFFLKETYKSLKLKPSKESMIMINVYLFGYRTRKSTGYRCSLNQWDLKKKQLKTGKARLGNSYEVNNFLLGLKTFVEKEISKYLLTPESFNINEFESKLKHKIKGIEFKKDIKTSNLLIDHSEKVVESKSDTIKVVSQRSLKQTIRLLALFEKQELSYGERIYLKDVDLSFYRKFKRFLEKNNYSMNTVGKHIKNLKSFMQDALVNGICDNQKFKNREFKVLKEDTTQIYLNEEEIEQLAATDLNEFPMMDRARDIFLIGCYTGQRVSDYNGLTKDNLVTLQGRKFIEIRQQKTKAQVLIPVTTKIQNILIKYDNNFPEKMSEPVLRHNIKEAARRSILNKPIKVQYTKGGKLIIKEVKQFKLVKTHTARRSFCTNYYMKQKPIQDIMAISGHKTEKMFYNYLRMEPIERALAIADSDFFD